MKHLDRALILIASLAFQPALAQQAPDAEAESPPLGFFITSEAPGSGNLGGHRRSPAC